MDFVFMAVRILTSIIAPVIALVFAFLTINHSRQAQGKTPQPDQTCIRCEKSQTGAEGQFHYTENMGQPNDSNTQLPINHENTPLLGSETHFVCDECARGYIRSEVVQLLLMVLAYPVYLYLIIPRFTALGVVANFLIETLLVVLSVTGTIAAFDLYMAVHLANTSLAEARDQLAINERKQLLGKKFSYYTRRGVTKLRE